MGDFRKKHIVKTGAFGSKQESWNICIIKLQIENKAEEIKFSLLMVL